MEMKLDLSQCPMWEDITPEQQEELFKELIYKLKEYKKGDLIARQGDACKHLYLLVKGSVKTEMITETGGLLTIEKINAVRPLASAFLFAENNTFPVDVTATEDSVVIMIPKDEVMRLFGKYPSFLHRYITYNANRTQFLSGKLQVLTIKTIKGKLAHYILEQFNIARKDNPSKKRFTLDKNQTELAKFFGVTRPSLARSLAEMEKDGLILTERKEITILDAKGLTELLA